MVAPSFLAKSTEGLVNGGPISNSDALLLVWGNSQFFASRAALGSERGRDRETSLVLEIVIVGLSLTLAVCDSSVANIFRDAST